MSANTTTMMWESLAPFSKPKRVPIHSAPVVALERLKKLIYHESSNDTYFFIDDSHYQWSNSIKIHYC